MQNKKRCVAGAVALVIFALGFALGNVVQVGSVAMAQSGRVFELRTYTTNPGRLDALHARFRDHTMRIFRKHGISNVGYWSPQDSPLADNTLVYVISHPSREAAANNWKAFGSDPEWRTVAEESQRDGRIVANVDSVFMDATDYSPMK